MFGYDDALGWDDRARREDKPASTRTYIIVGSISYVVAALFLVATVAILSHFYNNTVKSTSEAAAQLNVNINNEYTEAVAKNVDKIQFYQNTLASGRPAPMDEAQVAISWENGEITRQSMAEMDHTAAVAALHYSQSVSVPIGHVVVPARLLGVAFPLTAIIVAPVFRFMRINISVSGVINYLDVPLGIPVMPALAARIVSANTGADVSGGEGLVSEKNLSLSPLYLSPEPIVGFSRAVPFNVTGVIELEIPASANLSAPVATFGDVLQIVPVNFSHAQIAQFKLAVSGQNWGTAPTPDETSPPTLNEGQMFKLAA